MQLLASLCEHMLDRVKRERAADPGAFGFRLGGFKF
jgi:hypothetical protein